MVSDVVRDFIEKNKGRRGFLEHEVKGLLQEVGIPVPKGISFSKDKAVPLELGFYYPVVAKVFSSKIVSKSDVKGVRLNLENEGELRQAIIELRVIPDAEGFLIEEMAPQGFEVIIGGVMDKQFGPVVMFGLGGISVELFKDVAFALAPLKRNDALWLIKQVKGYRLLEGCRGRPSLHIDSLVNIIITVSEIMATCLIEEIDLNPVVLYPEGAIVLDAKMLSQLT